jgi:hypothetical protein
MLRSWATLARCYCDLLRFWRDCPDKACRRARRCRDHSGKCWNVRYWQAGERKNSLRERIRATRARMPLPVRDLPSRYDPSDSML